MNKGNKKQPKGWEWGWAHLYLLWESQNHIVPYSPVNALKAGWIRGDQIGKALTMCEDEMSFNKRNLGKLNSIKIDQIPPIWKMQNLFKNFKIAVHVYNRLQKLTILLPKYY